MEEKTLKFFRKSHRHVGIALAVFLLLVSVTGMLLNHTETLRLDHRFVPPFIAKQYYQNQTVAGFKLDEHYYYTLDKQLYADRVALTSCDTIQGIGRLPNQLAVLCDAELILLTPDHELIERIGVAYGLPVNLSRIAVQNDQLLLASDAEIFSFNTANLDAVKVTTVVRHWPERHTVPVDLLLNDSVSWQQFILDLHSGMFIGIAGKWLADLVAIFLIGMAISGLVMWRNPR